MSNKFFKFRCFTVEHGLCAMKVGTDGVLLGAWANGGRDILDVGTGSGLIALFMAQRNVEACVTAIDIDHDAFLQAQANACNSVFNDRITVVESSLQGFCCGVYDAVVCNPPFFVNSLKNKDEKKTTARHADTLSYHDLFAGASSLLKDDGEFSVIIPASCRYAFDMEAAFAGLFPSRVCAVSTLSRKPVSRFLLAYRKHPPASVEEASGFINNDDMSRSEWYGKLTEDFYL